MKNVCPATPIMDVVTIGYPCPGCKTQCDRGLPYLDPALLADKKRPFQVDTLCFVCHKRHRITYKLKKDKKIKLVDFIFQDKDILRKMKKTIQISG
jgi:hypothetical protein